jgi:glycosyltransferase involved in cell wall biosynthesis
VPQQKALVLSYSPISRDPRVRRQIHWLSSNGFEVEVWGLGPAPKAGEAKYHEMRLPGKLIRVLCYLLLSQSRRANLLVERPLDSLAKQLNQSSDYDLVLLNDLDFLSIEALFSSGNGEQRKVVVDLHEYFYDLGGSMTWRLLNSRYYKWLLSRLESRKFQSVVTVSDEIADLYESKLKRKVETVLNVPIPSDQCVEPDTRRTADHSGKIRLIHHGIFGKGRGIWRMIGAMKFVREPFELNLMLVGSKLKKMLAKVLISVLLLSEKVFIVEPVRFNEIVPTLRDFDLGVIFFHPPHSTSLRLAMPNKFFEFLNAGLGVISGPSPAISRLVQDWEVGVVSESWSMKSLANTINCLDIKQVQALKSKSELAYSNLPAEQLEKNFIKALNLGGDR